MLQLLHHFIERFKHTFWPILFWGWVVGVSLWLENIEVTDPTEQAQSGQFTNLNFKTMYFVQRYADGKLLNVKAPKAEFNSETRQLYIEYPKLTWNDVPNDRIFSATADVGLISANVGRSALPSEFNILNLKNNVIATTQQVAVQSQQMIFDNRNTFAIIKAPFSFNNSQTGMKGNVTEDRVFDPITQNLYGNTQEAIEARTRNKESE